MHICFLSGEYPFWCSGGIGSFIQTLGRELVKKGVKVSVVGTGPVDEEKFYNDCGVEVYRIPGSSFIKGSLFINNRRLRQKLEEIGRSSPVDVVESLENGFAFFSSKMPYKKVIRMHGGHYFFAESENRNVNLWKGYKERLSFKSADHILAVSKYVADQTALLLNMQLKVKVIYNFVDTDKFRPLPDVKVNKGQLLFIGTVCEKKGVKQLVESIPYILKEFPGAVLKIAGQDLISETGESFTESLKRLLPLPFNKHVHFLGRVDHDTIPKLIAESEIVVLPSFMEAMPIAWLEVLAAGKPLVAGDRGPAREAVIHGETGLLCNPYEPIDISRKVIYFLTHKDEAEKMGRAARYYVNQYFNKESIVQDNISFYSSIIEQVTV
ncbi:glycosyltransferase family 4 protein [Marinilabiliaceae bacterium ANBcel2]|nr:glycosyltransferase family 4 protein [Marinilabiliaceae bacterium ANBcel2]